MPSSIAFKDKELVKRRLAMGASTREAINGTSIKSNQTAATIAKSESHNIRQIREEYLNTIRQFGADETTRAKLWSEMIHATKLSSDGQMVPDWKVRYEALKYIDSLTGFHNEEILKSSLHPSPILVLDRDYQPSNSIPPILGGLSVPD